MGFKEKKRAKPRQKKWGKKKFLSSGGKAFISILSKATIFQKKGNLGHGPQERRTEIFLEKEITSLYWKRGKPLAWGEGKTSNDGGGKKGRKKPEPRTELGKKKF